MNDDEERNEYEFSCSMLKSLDKEWRDNVDDLPGSVVHSHYLSWFAAEGVKAMIDWVLEYEKKNPIPK